MTAITTAVDIIESPLVSILGSFIPGASPIIAILQRFAPIVAAAAPAIQEAVIAGKPVFDAAVAAAPKFSALIAQVMHFLPSPAGQDDGLTSGIMIENFTRALGGFHRMTFEEEQHWMNSMTPGNDPSQENSKITVG